MSIENLLAELTAAVRENTEVVKKQIEIASTTINVQVTGDVGGKRGRKPKTEVAVTPAADTDADDAAPPAEEPKVEEATKPEEKKKAVVEYATDGGGPRDPAVDNAHFRTEVKIRLLAYRDAVRDAVRDGEPAGTDPGEAVKKASAAAKALMAPFKAAKFDDVKDDDLLALDEAITKARAELEGGASDELDLDI